MQFFDTHIHLQDFERLTQDTLRSSGIKRCICVSAQPEDWAKVAHWYEKYPELVVPAFAVHPWYADHLPQTWAKELETYLQKYPLALVGECGFDRLKGPDYSLQAAVFDVQLALAQKYQRPLLIHAVKAWEWLAPYWAKMPSKFVFHSFNARPEQVELVVKANGFIAVNTSILKNKTRVPILKMIPSDKLLLETDAPYQSSIEELNDFCTFIAAVRGENVDSLAQILYQNGEELIRR